jgi:hypothetical protein
MSYAEQLEQCSFGEIAEIILDKLTTDKDFASETVLEALYAVAERGRAAEAFAIEQDVVNLFKARRAGKLDIVFVTN